jgi:SAM-dependent methyltransferase
MPKNPEYRFKVDPDSPAVTSDRPPVPAEEANGKFETWLTRRPAISMAGFHNLSLEGLKNLLEGRSRILDIGAGESGLHAVIPPKSQLVNVDLLHPAQLETANTAPWVNATGDVLPFPDNSFDFIISTFSLPYWSASDKQTQRYFAETYRCLKVGGICLTSPFGSSEQAHFNPEILPGSDSGSAVHIEAIPHWSPEDTIALKVKKGEDFTAFEAEQFYTPYAGMPASLAQTA